MGIDIEGGMIVGRTGSDLGITEYEQIDELEREDIEHMSLYYNADPKDRIYGYSVDDVMVKDIDKWVEEIKLKAEEFERLFGIPAKLYGTQDVW